MGPNGSVPPIKISAGPFLPGALPSALYPARHQPFAVFSRASRRAEICREHLQISDISMANYTSTANVILSVNGKQAQKMLSQLEKDARRTRLNSRCPLSKRCIRP